MKLTAKNITLENVRKSNYWKLISILVWNHYTEKEHQDENAITIKEQWCGTGGGFTSLNDNWDNPNYSEPGLIRQLECIKIIFKRHDYITHIYIHASGNIDCFGLYTDTDKTINECPYYYGSKRNLDITNWMLENSFLTIE